MIASENHAPLAVMHAHGSVLTNKYAEGYPGRRYYGGCEHIDGIAHLTHGMRLNFSGKLYRVAAGLHLTPVPHAHVVTSTTHKTLGGPRGGIILTNDGDIARKINSAVFPGQQGGPLEHVIAGKARAFKMAAEPDFVDRQQRCLDGAKILAERLSRPDVKDAGISVLTGGTDVHLVLVDLRHANIDGQQAEDRPEAIGITVNRNAVPFDPRPSVATSGLWIGTPALAARGFGAEGLRGRRRPHRTGARCGRRRGHVVAGGRSQRPGRQASSVPGDLTGNSCCTAQFDATG